MANIYRNPKKLPDFWTRDEPGNYWPVTEQAQALPIAPQQADPMQDAPPYPRRGVAGSPRMDFSFLRQPLKGGNLLKTLGLGLGAMALAKNPTETVGGILGGMNAWQGARQNRLDQDYNDQAMEWQRQDAARKWQEQQRAAAAMQAFKEQQAGIANQYKEDQLAATIDRNRLTNQNAQQGRAISLLSMYGGENPMVQDMAFRAGLWPFPRGSSTHGMVPAADGAETQEFPSTFGLGSQMGQRAAATEGTRLDNTFKDQTMDDRVKHQSWIPRLDAAALENRKTQTAAAAGREGRERALFSGKLKRQELENEMLESGRIPMLGAQLEGQRIRNRFLPQQLQAGLDKPGAGAGVNVPTGANAAIASGATSLIGTDFKVRGCARFVTATLQGAGVNIRGSENAAELERQIRDVGGVQVETDPARFKPGDIIVMNGSGPSGRHIMVVDSKGRIVGNPGTKTNTRVQVQGGGPGMVAYRLPEGTIGGKPPKTSVAKAPVVKATVAPKPPNAAQSGVDPATYKVLTGMGIAPGSKMLESFNWWVEHSPKLFTKNDDGEITGVDPTNKDYQAFMKDQARWRSAYTPGEPGFSSPANLSPGSAPRTPGLFSPVRMSAEIAKLRAYAKTPNSQWKVVAESDAFKNYTPEQKATMKKEYLAAKGL